MTRRYFVISSGNRVVPRMNPSSVLGDGGGFLLIIVRSGVIVQNRYAVNL